MQSIRAFRTDAPVPLEAYRQVDADIKVAARQAMIGRRLTPLYGPLGFGTQSITYDLLTEVADATLEFAWSARGSEDTGLTARTVVKVPVLKKPFRINARSLASMQESGIRLDTATAKSAAYKVSKLEDDLILDGFAADGSTYDLNGFYQDANNTEGTSKDFGTAGYAIDKVNLALAVLETDNIFPPVNMVLHPTQYREPHDVLSSTAVPEIDVVRRIIGGQIYETAAQTAATGMLVAAGDRGFFDLAVGVDMTSLMEILPLNFGKDLYGVVYECVVPRIWETNAICTLTSI
jgi:uncharacterized linocin/CFP29 family protein